MPQPVDLKAAKAKLAQLCSLREYSAKDIKDKLQKWELPPEDQEEVIQFLEKEGYLNELRFARAFCHDKFLFNGWGKLKIQQHLLAHQLDSAHIQTGLDAIDMGAYLDKLEKLATKKWEGLLKDGPYARKQKTVRFLAGRGFEMDLIWQVIKRKWG